MKITDFIAFETEEGTFTGNLLAISKTVYDFDPTNQLAAIVIARGEVVVAALKSGAAIKEQMRALDKETTDKILAVYNKDTDSVEELLFAYRDFNMEMRDAIAYIKHECMKVILAKRYFGDNMEAANAEIEISA